MYRMPPNLGWLGLTSSFYRDVLNHEGKVPPWYYSWLFPFLCTLPPYLKPLHYSESQKAVGPIYGLFMVTTAFPCCSYDTTPLTFSHLFGWSTVSPRANFLPTSSRRKLPNPLSIRLLQSLAFLGDNLTLNIVLSTDKYVPKFLRVQR